MRTVTLKTLTDLAKNFVSCLVALLALLLLGNVVGTVVKVADPEIAHAIMGQPIWTLLPYSLSIAWAPACLGSGLMTFGRMAADGEVEAVQYCGVPRRRLVLPAVPVAVILSVCACWLQSEARSWATRERRKAISTARVQHLPLLVSHGQRALAEMVPGLRIDYVSREGSTFYGLHLWRLRREGIPDCLTAARATFTFDLEGRKVTFDLEEGVIEVGTSRPGPGRRFDRIQFKHYALTVRLPEHWRELVSRLTHKDTSLLQLLRDRRNAGGESALHMTRELHSRLS